MHESPPDRYSFLSKLSDLARRLCPKKVASRKRLAAFLVSSGLTLIANIASGLLLWLMENKKPRHRGRHEKRD